MYNINRNAMQFLRHQSVSLHRLFFPPPATYLIAAIKSKLSLFLNYFATAFPARDHAKHRGRRKKSDAVARIDFARLAKRARVTYENWLTTLLSVACSGIYQVVDFKDDETGSLKLFQVPSATVVATGNNAAKALAA